MDGFMRFTDVLRLSKEFRENVHFSEEGNKSKLSHFQRDLLPTHG